MGYYAVILDKKHGIKVPFLNPQCASSDCRANTEYRSAEGKRDKILQQKNFVLELSENVSSI